MKASFVKKKITPPAGTDLTGFIGRHNPSQGIYDDLYVRILYLEETCQALIISADVIGFDLFATNEIQNGIAQRTGIPPANIIISATHTHSGPATMYLQSCGSVDKKYLAEIMTIIQKAAVEIIYSAQQVNVFFSAKDVSGLTYNRHRVLEDGTVTIKYDKEQKIIKEGPVDPKFSLLSFVNDKSEVIGCLCHYTCHPVVLGRDNANVSGDYPGLLSQYIEKKLGHDAVSLFINGASGNINPVYHNTGYHDALKMAEDLGETALELLNAKGEFISPDFTVQSYGLRLPLLPPPSMEEIEREEQDWMKKAQDPDITFLDQMIIHAMISWTMITKNLIQNNQLIDAIPVFIQQLQFDNLILGGVPGELFTEIALDLHQKISVPFLLMGYTNGVVGYFPEGYAYDSGGYAVDTAYRYYGLPSAFSREAGDSLFEAHLELACSPKHGKKGKKQPPQIDFNPNRYKVKGSYFKKRNKKK